MLLLFLLGTIFLAVIAGAFANTFKTAKVLDKALGTTNTGNRFTVARAAAKNNLPKAVEHLILFAQMVEIAHIIENATAIKLIVTFLLFGLWLALKSGTEEQRH